MPRGPRCKSCNSNTCFWSFRGLRIPRARGANRTILVLFLKFCNLGRPWGRLRAPLGGLGRFWGDLQEVSSRPCAILGVVCDREAASNDKPNRESVFSWGGAIWAVSLGGSWVVLWRPWESWAALGTSRGVLGLWGGSPGGLGLALRDLVGSLQEGSGL